MSQSNTDSRTISEQESVTGIMISEKKDLLKMRDACLEKLEGESKSSNTRRCRQQMLDLKKVALQDGNLTESLYSQANRMMNEVMKFTEMREHRVFFESLVHLCVDLMISESKSQYVSAVVHFIRHVVPNFSDIIVDIFDKVVMSPVLQDEADEPLFGERFFNDVQGMFDVRASVTATKTWKAIQHVLGLVVGFFFDFSPGNETKISEMVKSLVKPIDFGVGIFIQLVESVVLIIRQGYLWMHSGCISDFFYEKSSLSKWNKQFTDFEMKLYNMNSPDASRRSSDKDLLRIVSKLVSDGKEISKYLTDGEKRFFLKSFRKCMEIQSDLHNKVVGGKWRKAPFALLLNGVPSVGKTSFADHVCHFWASYKNVEYNDSTKYTRYPLDQFWSGYTTACSVVILDDIAFEHPNKIGSLAESSQRDIIQIVNNVPMVLNMADLSEKGKVMCCPDLVLATTNCKDLSAMHLFNTPYAALRRLKYVVTIEPNEEVMDNKGGLDVTHDGSCFDSLKDSVGEDWWHITVETPVPIYEGVGQDKVLQKQHRYEQLLETRSLAEFRLWLRSAIDAHDRVQEQIMRSYEQKSGRKYCYECGRFQSECECDKSTIQDGEVFASNSSNYGMHPVPSVFPSAINSNDLSYFWSVFWYTFSWGRFSLLLLFFHWGVRCLIPWVPSPLTIPCVFFSVFLRFYRQYDSVYYVAYLIFKSFPLSLQKRMLDLYVNWWAPRWIRNAWNAWRVGQTLLVLISAFSAYSCYKSYRSDYQNIASNAKKDDKNQVETAQVQGAVSSTEKVDIPDIYYNNVERTIATDLGAAINSFKGLSRDQILEKVGRNVVRLECFDVSEGDVQRKTGVGVFITGQVVLTNAHLFKSGHSFRIQHHMMNFPLVQRVASCDIVTDVTKDVMLIRFRNIAPMANLVKFFPGSDLMDLACSVSILTLDRDGTQIIHSSKCCRWFGPEEITHDLLGTVAYNKYYAYGIQTTRSGDCGSPYVAFTNYGPAIIGIHQSVRGVDVSCVALTRSYLEGLLCAFPPQIQGGSILRDTCTFTLVNWSKDSNFRRVPNAHMYVFGTSQRRFPTKSKVKRSLIFDDCVAHGFKDAFGAPVMRDRQVWINQIEPMVDRDCVEDHSLLDRATRLYIDEVFSEIAESDFLEIRVLSDQEALNGVDGLKYVDKIPRKTSAGFPFNKAKTHFLDFTDLANPVVVEEIRKDFENMQEIARRGERVMPIFMGALKDEPIKKKKIQAKKTRVFAGSPFAFSLLQRKYMLTMNAFIQKRRKTFECCAGVNALGGEWQDIHHWMSSLGENALQQMIAGDYAQYDKSMRASFILAAGEVLLEMAKRAGYSDEELTVVRVIMFDIAFPVYNIDGDIVMTCGSNPSGQVLTVIINSLVGSILIRMAWIHLNPKLPFKNFVRLVVYGDDNFMSSVKDNFNHTSIMTFLKTQGFEYTMADKEAESVPFISMEDVTFLKRSFVFSPDLNRIVGPLDRSSFGKMLMYTIPSGAIDEVNACVIVLDTYCREMFFYGREEFERERAWAMSIIEKNEWTQCVASSYFATYDELKDWYDEGLSLFEHPSNEYRTFIQCGTIDDDIPCPRCGYDDCCWTNSTYKICRRCSHCRCVNTIESDKMFLGCEHCETTYPMMCDICCDDEVGYQFIDDDRTCATFFCDSCMELFSPRNGFTAVLTKATSPRSRDASALCTGVECLYRCIVQPKPSAGQDAKWSINSCQKNQSRNTRGVSNQRVTGSDTREKWYPSQLQDGEDVQETVEFHNLMAPEQTILDHTVEELSAEMAETTANLADFFSRPIPIYTATWNESDSIGAFASFNPWHLFFNSDTVKYKLNNWAFLRCNLHLRFTYNASPFYYGAMMASYQPLPDFNRNFLRSSGTSNDLIPYSQMKGRILMFPQTPEDQEITLPFFHPANFLKCQSASDFTNMGKIWLNVMAGLQSANAVTGTGITVKVYAWATDVVLSGPSVGLALQDGDEYGVGPVSKPASAIANIAARLGDVPVIGRFATATQIGASAVSSIAKLFGFTNVPVIEDQKGVQPRALPPMATTDIGYPVEKLTVDSKNELTIDHRSVGLGPLDELPICHIAQKESWLTYTNWTTANSADQLLYCIGITPQLFGATSDANPYLYMTPMCWLSTMFNYWHGDIILRFKIVCSKYHRGRLRITFDPDGYAAKNIAVDSVSSNVTMTKIVDISEETDVELRVPYQQFTAWLNCHLANSFSQSTLKHSPTGFKHEREYTNGMVTIRVHNVLTAPVDTSSVSIHMFVRAAENLEFGSPTTAGLENLTPAVIQDGDVDCHADQAVVLKSKAVSPVDHLYLTYMGERVASLRVLLRRMCRVHTFAPAPNSSNDFIYRSITLNRQPLSYGYDTYGLDTAKGLISTGTTYNLNWVQGNFLSYVCPAFVGNRGSVNWTIVNDSGYSGTRPEHMVIVRDKSISTVGYYQNGTNIGSTSANASWWRTYQRTTGAGAAVTVNRVTGGASAQIPYYSYLKFNPTDLAVRNKVNSREYVSNDCFTVEFGHSASYGVSTNCAKYFFYAGAGTDYDLLYFLHVPTYGVMNSTPTSV